MFFQSFSEEGEQECEQIGAYFTRLYANTLAEVDCDYFGGDYVVEITENDRLVDKIIASPGYGGLIDSIRVIGPNMQAYLNRYRFEQKVLWFDADDYERDGWGEYIEFSIIHE